MRRPSLGNPNVDRTNVVTRPVSSVNNKSESIPLVEVVRIRSCMRVVSLRDSLHCSTPLNTTRKPPKHVAWGKVFIRTYERMLSDNPSCSSGPPVGIGWHYHHTDQQAHINHYEATKPESRSEYELVLSREVRRDMLEEWGYTGSQLAQAVRSNIQTKNQRRRTINNLGTYDKIDAVIEKTSRKFKRTFLFKKSSTKEALEMQKEADKIASTLAQLSSIVDTSQHSSKDLVEIEQSRLVRMGP
mmetsp:Transcript_14702/g.22972  ORF Transcript_14702/g.22972 Transcript_14702/m.22972 type:complete len:243 (+) Transcript_14702:110-838(+)|eukprot:CAMPEP_0195291988 /NCGR_PEP_ID=MMETSP0707-20130614/8549_1 /TAXON_ID=33640 /ORGANISM="Asterionellopsis glacialis, Strain CCMP134" /LENGTH=242 /DNA_ID=CAMNT_0040352359 /DNA_START=59 /DNA_END=787 /DNA_ORIENTATION=+